MGESALAGKSERLMSLDAFRGLTIAGMVLVNNPGTWGRIYDPLEHAQWHGWTPTDFVFPFFLFIMGVAMTFSFDKRIARGDSKMRLFEQVVRRSLILLLLGLIMGGFPNFKLITAHILFIIGLSYIYTDEPILGWGQADKQKRNKLIGWALVVASIVWAGVYLYTYGKLAGRIPGVLARISVCYLFASIIMLRTGLWGRIGWTLFLINIYWIIMKYIPAPGGYVIAEASRDAPVGAPFPGHLNDWIDVKLLGSHLYSRRPDPEGLLSTIPAIATVLSGVLTGTFLLTNRSRVEKAAIMFAVGNALIIVGACMDLYFPINKKIWTSSYVIFCTGWALACLAPCYYLIDVKGWQKWSMPLQVFGTNAILIFFASGLMARLLGMIDVGTAGNKVALKTYMYRNWFQSWLEPAELASLGFALCYVLLWLGITYPLYRKRIFLKV